MFWGLVGLAYLAIMVWAVSYFWIFELATDYYNKKPEKARRVYGIFWHMAAALWLFVLIWYIAWMIWRDSPAPGE